MNEEVNKYIISSYVFVIQAMEKEVMCGAKVYVQVSYNGGQMCTPLTTLLYVTLKHYNKPLFIIIEIPVF